MAKSLFVCISLLLLLRLTSQTTDPSTPNRNSISSPSPAHTELTNYGFPIGLLPTAVKNYTINRTTGDFIVDLGGACKVTLPPDNYLATYSKKITGKIVEGKIAEINGISVRAATPLLSRVSSCDASHMRRRPVADSKTDAT
ncbi:uncharacterized protein LOC126605324 [Malus sylvestris]|uniref:uncharacterized protein LOC126605324 n=1 Tax=Malus sylvestris TaxID=3752 RepID=UPI0021ACC9D8|nr:uncharacterized protein LOC126605324 [Malus sylvestris]